MTMLQAKFLKTAVRSRLRFTAVLVAALAALFAIALPATAADDKPAETTRPAPRRLLIGDYSKHILAIVTDDGKVEWEHKVGDIHDAEVLASGNILFQTSWTQLYEKTRDGKTVWEYNAATSNGNEGRKVEVHSFERLANRNTLIAESGPSRIIEVDRQGKLVHEVKLKVTKSDVHRDTRLVRKLKTGNYLVAQESEQVVREYDPTGKIVWEYPVGSRVYSAKRLINGNTLIGAGSGSRVVEVSLDGKTVWSVEKDDLPGIKLAWVTMVDRLPNGNTLIVNCHAGPDNPQIIEVTPEKKVVWTFKDFQRFGNSLPVARIVD